MSCPTNCTPLKQALNDSVIPLHGKIPCLGKTLKGQNCKAPISRDRQTKALCILECCIYCARPGGLPLKYAINDLAKLLVHQQHNGEQDAAYARWRNMVKEFKGKGENPMREHPSETIDEPVDPELIATRRHAHTIERNGSNQTSSLSYEEPTEIQQDQTVEGGQPDRDMVIQPNVLYLAHPTECRKSVSLQTDVYGIYTPITLWSCFLGLILQCGIMICSLFNLQFGPRFCDCGRNLKNGSVVRFKLELAIRWSLSDIPRWVLFTGISVLPSILLGRWLRLLYLLDWDAIAGKSYRIGV